MVVNSKFSNLSPSFLSYRDPAKSEIGVYVIRNVHNNRLYVGSTKIGFGERFSEHRSDLNRNRHGNPRLQNSWNKRGEQSFAFFILEVCDNPDDTLMREQFFIDALNPYYNIAKDAESCFFGRRHTKESKRKMSEANAGRKWSQEHRANFIASMSLRDKSGDRVRYAEGGKRLIEYHKSISPELRQEWLKKLSESHMGQCLSQESRIKLAESVRKSWIKRKQISKTGHKTHGS